MHSRSYELTAAQAAFLENAKHAPKTTRVPKSRHPPRVRFAGILPPVTNQSVRGTCVANAVAALVACYEGCRRQISIQYLDEVTRLVEQAWIARNLKSIIAGESPEKDFEAAFPDAVAQAALLVRTNGIGSEAAAAFVRSLGSKIRARVEADAGCRLKRCFEALEEYGVCKEELWPYSPVAMNLSAAGADAVGSFPPGTHEDARRHRIVDGLYVLRSPNNVDEIKGLLSGEQGRRPMPVCLGLDLFEGLTDGEFALPDITYDDNRAKVVQRTLGLHEVLVIAYTDDARYPGGGYFTFQNSWGNQWGDEGKGRVSYAYVACFCREAGTILQMAEDVSSSIAGANAGYHAARRRVAIFVAVGVCLFTAAISGLIAIWAMRDSKAAEKTMHKPAKCVQEVKVEADEEQDDDFDVKKVVAYRFKVRGICDSKVEAMSMVYALDRDHREFSFEDMRLTDDQHGFEGEITIDGVVGKPPDVEKTVNSYLNRKKIESVVRKWSVKRLR